MIQDKIFFDEKDPTGLSYNTPFTFYGSYQGRLWSKSPSGSIQYYTQNSDLSAYATTGSNQFSGSQTVTGSLTVTGTITGTVAGTTATASYVEYTNVANKPTLISGSAQIASFGIFATTGSNGFNGSQSITGSLTVTGQVVAQTLNVQQVTSSIVYSSGSNVFGNSLANTQQLTGSVSVTGSFAVTTTGIELQVTNAGVNLGNIVTDNHNVTGSLRVSGSMAVTGAGTFSSSVTATNAILSATGYLGFGGGTNYIEGDNNNNIVRIGTNNVPRVTINSSGNVGIGTASPGSILQANFSNATTYSSGVTGNGLTLYNTSTTNNQYVGLYFLGEPASGNAGQATIYGITTGTGAMDLAFSTRGSSVLAERMRITSGGNIEIGTTGFSSPSGADRFIGVYGAQDSSLILQDAVQLWELYVNDDFYINRGSTNVLTALRSNGNVGIGTTSPGAKLDVKGASATTTSLQFDHGGATYGNFIQSYGGGVYDKLSLIGNDIIFFGSGPSEKVRVTANGLTFNGDTAAANALDDYEEGTVNITTLTDGVATFTQEVGFRSLCYTKIGNRVFVSGNIYNQSISGTWTNPLRIPLPFTAASSDGRARSTGHVALYNWGTSDNITKIEYNGATYAEIVSAGNGGAWGTVTTSAGFTAIVNFSYITTV